MTACPKCKKTWEGDHEGPTIEKTGMCISCLGYCVVCCPNGRQDREYTVIGIYEDTSQVFLEIIEAQTPDKAFEKAAKSAECPELLVLVAAVLNGHEINGGEFDRRTVEIVTPCKDGGLGEYASKLQESV